MVEEVVAEIDLSGHHPTSICSTTHLNHPPRHRRLNTEGTLIVPLSRRGGIHALTAKAARRRDARVSCLLQPCGWTSEGFASARREPSES